MENGLFFVLFSGFQVLDEGVQFYDCCFDLFDHLGADRGVQIPALFCRRKMVDQLIERSARLSAELNIFLVVEATITFPPGRSIIQFYIFLST